MSKKDTVMAATNAVLEAIQIHRNDGWIGEGRPIKPSEKLYAYAGVELDAIAERVGETFGIDLSDLCRSCEMGEMTVQSYIEVVVSRIEAKAA